MTEQPDQRRFTGIDGHQHHQTSDLRITNLVRGRNRGADLRHAFRLQHARGGDRGDRPRRLPNDLGILVVEMTNRQRHHRRTGTVAEKLESRREHGGIGLVFERGHHLRGEILASHRFEKPSRRDPDRRIRVVEGREQAGAEDFGKNPTVSKHALHLGDRGGPKRKFGVLEQFENPLIAIGLGQRRQEPGVKIGEPDRERIRPGLRSSRPFIRPLDPIDQLSEGL